MPIAKEKGLGKLKGLQADKSPGPDGLYPRVQKEVAEEIVQALVVIFQESLEAKSVQEDLKMANEVMSKLDKGESVHVIYFDFQEDIDKVPHKKLLNKSL
eukprot:g19875.t1